MGREIAPRRRFKAALAAYYFVRRWAVALTSVAEAAKELGICRSTLYSLIRQRRVSCVRLGDRVLVSVPKIIAELEIPAELAEGPSVSITKGRRKAVEGA
jgi:excisionase family DNA binding protein